MDEFPNPTAQASFDRVKPIVEKVDSYLGSERLLRHGERYHDQRWRPARASTVERQAALRSNGAIMHAATSFDQKLNILSS
jgi:hypothetical protein